jgi:hypothetical protein
MLYRQQPAGSRQKEASVNPFLEIVRTANELSWCTKPGCTTCGAREYRQALAALAGPLGAGLLSALVDIEPRDLAGMPNWQDPLLVAVMDLPFNGQVDDVLEVWLPHLAVDIAFADFVLFRIVRRMSPDNPVRARWIDGCRELALETRDFSLVESLILVLGSAALLDADLISVASEHAEHSAQMQRVLRNACGLNLPPPRR